jgi:hypothetical protein
MVMSLLALGLVGALPAPSMAMPLKAGAGYDYYSGPNDQLTRSVQALIVADLGSVAGVSLIATRFDDNLVGKGTSFTAGLGVAITPMATLRIYGSRYQADQDYRAWRIKAGPELHLPPGQSLGLYYSHYDDHSDATSDAVIAELATPLVEHLTGRATAAYATATAGSPSGQGALGLTWSPIHGVDLLGDVGIAKSGTAAAQPFPSHKRSLHLPLIGGEPEPGATAEHGSSRATATAELGMRILLP